MTLVAVYGTLKEGHYNYERYLKGESAIFRSFAEIPYRMYENGEYPMLVPEDDGERHRIWLEVFDLDADKLKDLDDLEAPYGYWRETIHLDELGCDVEIYLHRAPAPPGFTLVLSGDWRG